MSILPGMRDFNRAHAAHKPYTLKDRGGVREQLVSDNGPQFNREEFSQFLQSTDIRHLSTAPYHPATNGLGAVKLHFRCCRNILDVGLVT